MQEIRRTQQCTNNDTLSNQQTHRRSLIVNLLSKFGKRKLEGSLAALLLFKGGYYLRGQSSVKLHQFMCL